MGSRSISISSTRPTRGRPGGRPSARSHGWSRRGWCEPSGVSNVNRAQLDEALEHAPVRAVEVALSVFDVRTLRGGIVDRCAEHGIALLAHSPLGGPAGPERLDRLDGVRAVADRHAATPAQIALAWLLDLHPTVVAIPGARTPEAARSVARAAHLRLEPEDRAILAQAVDAPSPRAPRKHARTGDVVVVMGIPGAGKSRVAGDYVARGYQRLNRDERGGSLRELATALDESLAAGERHVVLDNTYLTRAARSFVVEAAERHGLAARCLWLDTPLAQAQVNLASASSRLRLSALAGGAAGTCARAGARRPDLPDAGLPRARGARPGRGLRNRGADPVRARAAAGRTGAGVLVAAAALDRPGWRVALDGCDPDAPHLLFDWRPGGAVDAREPAARLARRSGAGSSPRSVRIRQGRRSAGAARRSRASPSRSRRGTASTSRGRPSWARALRTARSRPRSARAQSSSDSASCGRPPQQQPADSTGWMTGSPRRSGVLVFTALTIAPCIPSATA